MTSRWQVAGKLTGSLKADRATVVRQTAAWLIASGRQRQAGYVARDVALQLVGNGYVYARVTAARPLEPAARREVEAFIRRHTDAREIELEVIIDKNVLGGVHVELPGRQLDATARGRLRRLVEGVSA